MSCKQQPVPEESDADVRSGRGPPSGEVGWREASVGAERRARRRCKKELRDVRSQKQLAQGREGPVGGGGRDAIHSQHWQGLVLETKWTCGTVSNGTPGRDPGPRVLAYALQESLSHLHLTTSAEMAQDS